MKSIKFTLYLLVIFFSSLSLAQLSDESYLNKLSSALRGIAPSMQEYADLENAKKSNQIQEFFASKRMQYMGSSLYVDKMRWRVIELLKLSAADTVKLLNPDIPKNDVSRLNSTDALLVTLFSENRSWDFLLTGHEYKIFNVKTEFFNLEETDLHFRQVMSEEQKQAAKKLSVGASMSLEFPESDGRFAGILTSERFFKRYATTAVNKNRRRAAAIFKNFLCDNMVAAVPDPGENKSKIIDIQYPNQNNSHFNEQEINAAAQMSDGLHGSQADCRACHYKLDPMGKVFLGSQVILSSHPWPGALVYKNSKKEIVNIPVNNVNELGKAITTQNDYVRCQVRHFWDWFIGKDIQLTDKIEEDLIQQFNAVERRPNDFINLLVQRSEFKTRRIEDPTQTIARQTKEIFKKCQSCHAGKTDEITGEPLIDLTLWPLGQNTSETDPQYWIERITKKLDLNHGGRDRTMPPKTINWSLTREELLTIQKWIELGTPANTLKAPAK